MKVLIDTCVVLDFLQKREPFFQSSYFVFLALANRQFTGAITASSVTDIYYMMHRHFRDNVKSRNAISGLFKILSVLDTTSSDCKNALLSPVTDFEDAVMCETANRTQMSYIVTRNIKDFQKSRIKVISPDELLDILSK